MANKEFYKQTTLPGILGISLEEVEPPTLPETIGPYKIESLLAKGGMSLLYLALHPTTKQPLVVKVLSPQFVAHPEATERFLQEAHIITLANHPNIVKLYGEGKWEGGLYIAMEMIRGVSLRQFITHQSFSLKRTLEIVLQVAYALLHLHTHGVIHRDLKPENILIAEDGSIKVIDFGIAQLHDGTKKPQGASPLMGTLNYMSPEQKENPHQVSFASDIYSLGVIMYELILGKLSFGMIDLGLLPKGMRRIVGKALAISVKERYQDIVDFIADLSQYIKSGEIDKDKPGTDQIKEILETIERTSQTLSPLQPLDWPPAEIGMAKFKAPGASNLYYDFFKFPNNTCVILLGTSLSPLIDAPIFLASLRGMVRVMVREKKTSFDPISFLQYLNNILQEDHWKQQFGLSLLLLDPFQDVLHFISCGLGSLIHVPTGNAKPRLLESTNAVLGTSLSPEFMEVHDNWRSGDLLFLHSLDPLLAPDLLNAITENLLLSPNRQADNILRKLSTTPFFSSQKQPKALLSIRRIA